MIKNERQYRVTKSYADRFAHTLQSLRDGQDEERGLHPLIRKAQQEAISSQLVDLENELRDYESLQRGEYRVDELKAIDELPSALIKARISLGLSQKDLANRLGLKEQQIQRYEATDYASASLTRIKEVVEALNQDLANPSPE